MLVMFLLLLRKFLFFGGTKTKFRSNIQIYDNEFFSDGYKYLKHWSM